MTAQIQVEALGKLCQELVFNTEDELRDFLATVKVPGEISRLGGVATERYYEWCLKNGGIPVGVFQEDLAICFARQRACGSKATDRAFQEGLQSRYTGKEIWFKKARDKYKKATGHDLPAGAMYVSQLATEPNDPKAWVFDRGDLARRAKELGRGVEEMGIKAVDMPDTRDTRPRLAEDLVQRHLRKAVADPNNIGKDVGELRHNIIEKHAFNPKRD